jgi:hypothetical protein
MDWIYESIKKSKANRKHYKMHEVDIFIKDPITPGIDADLVFSSFKRMIPSHLLSGVDIIYVGNFDVFKKKQVNAVFQDGAIYVTNEQSSNEDMIDDIIHELAHSVEEKFTEFIYDDNSLKEEFLSKRKSLHSILKTYEYNPPRSLITNIYYDLDVDMYLYKEVGYEALWNLINGIFLSPYSVTSLREYFAIGFEFYFMKDKSMIKKLCPRLYSKIELLEYMGAK